MPAHAVLFRLTLALCCAVATATHAETIAPKAEPAVQTQTDGQIYCQAIATAANDARVAWEMRKLAEAETQMRQRIADLNARQAEVQAWIAKREAFLQQANEGVLAVYNKMKPEAAASQLALMDEPMAAALLTKMSVRTASAILNEMTADRAARLAAAMRAAGNENGKT